jgi:hypothetical protein
VSRLDKDSKLVCGHHFEFAARTEDSARELRPSWEEETTAEMTCTATAAAAPVAVGAPCTSAAPQQQEQRRSDLQERATVHEGPPPPFNRPFPNSAIPSPSQSHLGLRDTLCSYEGYGMGPKNKKGGNTSTRPTVVVSAVSSLVSTSSCSCTRVPASAAVRLQSRPLYPGKHLLGRRLEPHTAHCSMRVECIAEGLATWPWMR